MHWPDDRLRELFGIRHPIVLAPMAGSAGTDLAAAVCRGGGLGTLPCASLSLDEIEQQVDTVRRHAPGPLSLNFFCHRHAAYDEAAERAWLAEFDRYGEELGVAPALHAEGANLAPFGEAHCRLLEALRPTVASFHFGLPADDLVARVKQAGCKVISTANTVAEATWLAEHGCDAIIAQGTEAGGHRGMFLPGSVAAQAGTFSLLPQVVDAVPVPVIAAGGIADGRGIAAALALGAAGVQIGTAYLFTDESLAGPLYRERLGRATDDATVITNVFSGRPARGMANRLTRELGPMHPAPAAFPMGYGVLGPYRKAAEASGSADFSAHLAGQSAALGRAGPAEAMTLRLVEETRRVLKRLAS